MRTLFMRIPLDSRLIGEGILIESGIPGSYTRPALAKPGAWRVARSSLPAGAVLSGRKLRV
jgi:hypothetical protein